MSDLDQQTFPEVEAALQRKIRFVEDFPSEGILFQDLTPVLADAETFTTVIDGLAGVAEDFGAELIAGLDARGFLLGSAVAYRLGLGCLAIRKQGKLPPPVHSRSYDLEYGSAALEVPADAIDLAGRRVVVIDDVLATGGTLQAAGELLKDCGAEVAGNIVVLEVDGLGGRERIGDAGVVVVGGHPVP